jgi:hypothetical protein
MGAATLQTREEHEVLSNVGLQAICKQPATNGSEITAVSTSRKGCWFALTRMP